MTAALTSMADITRQKLALLGGPQAIAADEPDLFQWPIVTPEDERAVLEVLRAGNMSGTDITEQFEAEYAQYQGRRFALGHCNGTMALLAAMYAVGVRQGDEVICPSITYWASGLPAFSLGATVVLADIDPRTLCIDPKAIERHIGPRTRAIVAVHYCGHPADMDPILTIARKHALKVIEDASHAHGGLYKGRMVGSLGDVGAMSMMSLKSFAIGEAGMLVTDDPAIYEAAVAFGHYERIVRTLTRPDLKQMAILESYAGGLPLGGVKARMNQTCAAMGRVQLKYYPQRIVEIQKAMNRFWDLLEGVPGMQPHRPPTGTGSTMGGWYNPVGLYHADELGGLPLDKFMAAVNAEGGRTGRGLNFPLHLHPLFNTVDVYGDGKPTRLAHATREVRQPPGSLPVAERIGRAAFGVPWFKHDRPESIARYAAAFKKVALQADKLMAI
jgi:perosamine synthetase